MVTLRLKHALLALIATAAPALAGEPKTAMLDVPSMFCSLCELTVKKALERVPGVIEAKASLATKRAEVRYDPDKVAPEQLANALSNSGFPAKLRSQ